MATSVFLIVSGCGESATDFSADGAAKSDAPASTGRILGGSGGTGNGGASGAGGTLSGGNGGATAGGAGGGTLDAPAAGGTPGKTGGAGGSSTGSAGVDGSTSASVDGNPGSGGSATGGAAGTAGATSTGGIPGTGGIESVCGGRSNCIVYCNVPPCICYCEGGTGGSGGSTTTGGAPGSGGAAGDGGIDTGLGIIDGGRPAQVTLRKVYAYGNCMPSIAADPIIVLWTVDITEATGASAQITKATISVSKGTSIVQDFAVEQPTVSLVNGAGSADQRKSLASVSPNQACSSMCSGATYQLDLVFDIDGQHIPASQTGAFSCAY